MQTLRTDLHFAHECTLHGLALRSLAIEGIPYVTPAAYWSRPLGNSPGYKDHPPSADQEDHRPPEFLGTDRQTPGIYLATRGLRQEGRVGRLSRPRGESVRRLTQLWVCLQVRWTTSESGALHARPPDDLDGESRLLFTALGGFLLESAAAFPRACPFRG